MKCLFIGKSAENPSTRYRLEPVAQALRASGHEVRVHYEPDFPTQIKLVLIAGAFDVLFIQRKLLSAPVVRLLRRRIRCLVFDYDDAVFLKSDGAVSASRSAKFKAVCSRADLVLPGNGYLSEAAQDLGANIMLTPTCVDIGRYTNDAPKLDEFTLVWIGSSSTARYLELIRDDLEAVGKVIPGACLRVIADFDFALKNMKVQNLRWSDDTESDALSQCHVGIAPMKDDPWTRGKCALKVIQYMAAELPVISSDVGANRDVVTDGETGYLVSDRQGWIIAAKNLQESSELRKKMGAHARQVAVEQYSMTQVSERVVAQLVDLVQTKTV
ncbi:MAG: glycosyltransferase [Pseudomonadales bacterium]|nr:glycosyltransferase [Pseudomonadales bacterium]MBO6703140.1 glycosyltransferase [Pseudomonadales bacterium]MBO7007163.1 glycosyltransferase [Pseudomonadales bacterium]